VKKLTCNQDVKNKNEISTGNIAHLLANDFFSKIDCWRKLGRQWNLEK
jgi:hypothetical protein